MTNRRGRTMRARAMMSIFCSPPDKVPAFCANRCSKNGKKANTRPNSVAECPIVGSGEAQVVAHRKILKDRSLLRSMRNPVARHDVRRRSGHVVAADDNSSVARRQKSQDGASERGLAHAILAEQRNYFAAADRK